LKTYLVPCFTGSNDSQSAHLITTNEEHTDTALVLSPALCAQAHSISSSAVLALLQNSSRSQIWDVVGFISVQIILGRASKDMGVVIVYLVGETEKEVGIEKKWALTAE
jgi:hypothetical protein